MRSIALRRLLGGIVASVVPVAAVAGCGGENSNNLDCSGQEGQERTFVTLDNEGHTIDISSSSPLIADAAFDAMATDAGADAGADGGPPDCVPACTFLGCTASTLRECTILGRTDDRWFVRCDLDTHVFCFPHGLICGRRPSGWVYALTNQEGRSGPLAALLSQMASLEAASVPAFRVLARELEAHGAPRALYRAAERAATDEVRHARMMADLARRHGGRPITPRVRRGGVRPLSRIALENCVEGCVRETFGALVAMWQAREAKDPELRSAMRLIARDEVRHAALAFRVAQWIERRLDAEQIARIGVVRKRAIADLRREVGWEPPRELVAGAGLPTSNQARQLVDSVAQALWAA